MQEKNVIQLREEYHRTQASLCDNFGLMVLQDGEECGRKLLDFNLHLLISKCFENDNQTINDLYNKHTIYDCGINTRKSYQKS